MKTEEIPREQWDQLFHQFSFRHEGWLATLEIFTPDAGAQVEAHNIPFTGISLAGERGDAIVIDMHKTPSDHVSHVIQKPTRVLLQTTEAGAYAALEIEAEDDSRTLLRFRSAMPPELVDGVVLEP